MSAVRSRRANPTGDMTIVDHLRELRYRIAIILAGIVVPTRRRSIEDIDDNHALPVEPATPRPASSLIILA